MRAKVAVIYSEPAAYPYEPIGEDKTENSIIEVVEAVQKALAELGYSAVLAPLMPPMEQARKVLSGIEAKVVFNLFEGFAGHPEMEAVVASILANRGIAYTGCPSSALALALDKYKTSALLRASGINAPKQQLLDPESLSTFQLSYPCIVKPYKEDGSHGLSADSVVHNFDSLKRQVEEVSTHFGGKALVEEFIGGREFNATVLGNSETTVLPISEVIYSLPPEMPRILTWESKWADGTMYFEGTSVVCPAQIADEERQRMAGIALAASQLIGCQGYSRVDMRLDRKGQIRVIEVNPNPDLSPGTGAARQAAAAGMTYTQFIDRIVQLALERSNHHATPDTANEGGGQAACDVHLAGDTRIHVGRGDRS